MSDNNHHEKETIFNEALHEFGGRLTEKGVDPSSLPLFESRLFFYRTILDIHRTAQPPFFPSGDLHVDYVSARIINGISFQYFDQEFIGLFVGTTALLHDIFLALLSCPMVTQGIGKSDLEYLSVSELKAYLKRDLSQGRYCDYYPNDPIRKQYAYELARIADMFIFYHELGHINRGHLLFVANRFQDNFSFILEYPHMGVVNSMSQKEAQALEIDADENAAQATILHVLDVPDFLHDEEFQTSSAKIKRWAYALGVVFHFLDLHTHDPSVYEESPHPNPALRLEHQLLCGFDTIRREYPYLMGIYQDSIEEAMNDIELLWNLIDMPAESFCFEVAKSRQKISDIRNQLYAIEKATLDQLALQRARELRIQK